MDNKPINHPMFLSNLKTLFPKHDFDSGPPAGFLEFIRVPEPELGPYQKFVDSIGVFLRVYETQ